MSARNTAPMPHRHTQHFFDHTTTHQERPMPHLSFGHWLILAIALALLVGSVIMYFKARHEAGQVLECRTADYSAIERQSKKLLIDPMASRRVRATTERIPPGHLTSLERAGRVETRVNLDQLRTRAIAAAIHDMGHGGKRRPGPYTLGTTEHAAWRLAYDTAFAEKPVTVQTTAQRPEETRAA